jgi:hypothetical protein
MTVPAPRTWVVGFVDEQDLNDEVRDPLLFLLGPPRVGCYKSGDGALANNTWDEINFNAEFYDSHSAHDNSTNNSRISAPESGLYDIRVSVEFEANATGSRRVNVRKNAAGNQASGTSLRFKVVNAVAGAGNETTVDLAFEAQLAAGDYIEVFCHQTSGGALNVIGAQDGTAASIRWVAKSI